MPRSRPATTGYERLAQADRFSDDSDADDDPLGASFASLQPASAPRFAPITQPRPRSTMHSPHASHSYSFQAAASSSRPSHTRNSHSYHHNGRPGGRRARSNSGVDLKALNARLERWADEIAQKFKRHGKRRKGEDDERLEIHHSVFQAPEGVRPATAEGLAAGLEGHGDGEGAAPVMRREEFEAIVESVRTAIENGMHPRMIAQGSSGSYFARNGDGKVVGVFKPKDEEPYAAGNPKWNKWIHRNLFPCCFGRACLIPNLSYVSEAAAYVLDTQLRTHMVPYTDVVYLSSKSFHYPFWDRYARSRNRRPLPAKPGSFQVFLKGFKDANIFLREHPWPDQYLSGFRTSETHRNRKRRWADNCRPSGRGSNSGDGQAESDYEDDEGGSSSGLATPGPDNFVWTESLKQSFREELEKLVVLDYIMRNTDRGLDNWMIRVDWSTQEVSIASEPLQLNMDGSNGGSKDGTEQGPRPVDLSQRQQQDRAAYPYRTQKPMEAAAAAPAARLDPKISIGAIDNSLSWPWKHPDAWRSFPFGWLFLPVDLIGRPFSQRTRDHFLPLLTSTAWWAQTSLALRRVFQLDPDFQERMFARQLAVIKGQAWNVVETLKTPDHGPLELTRRPKVCVWDDLVDVPTAVPMRSSSVTSDEMRRRADRHHRRQASDAVGGNKAGVAGGVSEDIDEEEMDIGAHASGAADSNVDLLGPTSPPALIDLPHPGRFELTNESDDISSAQQNTDAAPKPNGTPSSPPTRPTVERARTSQSHRPSASRKHERRYSFAASARARRDSSSIAHRMFHHHGDSGDSDGDMDGDLGYAAAEGMEGNRRKVIVERLEMVKARNPVFTWC